MTEWWLLRTILEFVLCVVIMVQSLAKKKAEFEPSEPSSTSGDIHERKTRPLRSGTTRIVSTSSVSPRFEFSRCARGCQKNEDKHK